ncbi:MAG: M20 family metallopeptidase [Rhodomicrobium sp.]
MISPIELTQELIRFETVNPPGNEAPCARYLGRILEAAGFETRLVQMAPDRENLIARIGGSGGKLPLAFTGHMDVVPLGALPWSADPFGGAIADGRIYGRGSSDMKSGVAAIVSAVVKLAPKLGSTPGAVLAITADEEVGCKGGKFMRDNGVLPPAGALIVGEPTANRLLAGHKGTFWVEGTAKGVTAHGSMPEEGVNAVYKAARAVLALAELDFSAGAHPLLGRPTLSVGWLRGGINTNSVPDEARFGLDIRLVPGVDPQALIERLEKATAGEVTFEVKGKNAPVWTDPAEPWIAGLADIVHSVTGVASSIGGANFYTDAGELKPGMGDPPTVILGPGEPAQAHQTDEYCLISRVEEAEAIYAEAIAQWCGL